MLKNIPKNLSPELIKTLMEMGHGDEIIIADGNYPAASNARNLIRLDGTAIPDLLKSILIFFPLDNYVESAITLMKVAEEDSITPDIWRKYKEIVKLSNAENTAIELVERYNFYERGKHAYAIVATGEEAMYANILLKKGVVK